MGGITPTYERFTMKLTNSDYALRIAQANPAQLVVITYELTLNAIESAQNSGGDDFDAFIEKAKDCLFELMAGLDMGIEFSTPLMEIYRYVNGLLITAGLTADSDKRDKSLSDAHKLLTTLHDGWKQVSETSNAAALFESVPKVYSGLTYDRLGNPTEFNPDDHTRGKKV